MSRLARLGLAIVQPLEGGQRPLGIRRPSETLVNPHERVVRIRVLRIELDGLHQLCRRFIDLAAVLEKHA